MKHDDLMAAVLRRSHLTRFELKIAECLAVLRAGHNTEDVSATLLKMREAKQVVEAEMQAAGQR